MPGCSTAFSSRRIRRIPTVRWGLPASRDLSCVRTKRCQLTLLPSFPPPTHPRTPTTSLPRGASKATKKRRLLPPSLELVVYHDGPVEGRDDGACDFHTEGLPDEAVRLVLGSKEIVAVPEPTLRILHITGLDCRC